MYSNILYLGLLASVTTALPRRATRLEQAASQRHADTQNFKRALHSNHFGIPGTDASYDYIVVGGGTGGLAVAARLAESGQSVAVIEAGGFYEVENGNVSVVPALNLAYDNDTAESFDATPLVDWGFVTTPQPWLGNRSLHYGRGKMLGGSSAENAMIYNRGTEQSYQLWADHVNDSSWTFDALLPYFRKGINFTLPNVALRAPNSSVPLPSSEAYNASGGPVQLSYSNFALPFSSWINLAMRELGFPFAQDFSSGQLLGSQYAPSLIDATNEHRSSSQASYLDAAFKAELYNLKVYTHALAKQIIFNTNKTATDVKVTSGQSTFTLHANKEIVLSAGAFHSPQLLMVSGVGPRETLEANNISIVADRPGVGQFLWDHMDVEVTYGVNVESFNNLNSVDYATRAAADFNSFPPTGILTSAGADYIGWEKLPEANRANLSAQALSDLTAFPSDWPEIEYEIASVYRSTNTSDTSGYGTIVMINVAPLSRGTVTISSNDTTDLPIVDPKWYSNATDREVSVQGVRRALAMFNTSAMEPVLTSEAIAPGPDVQTDEQIWDYISQTSFMNWHAACTCRMGRVDDPMTVVDSNGRVVGVQGLRVADASAFALLPPGHPTSTVYVVAEKIAADILATT